MIVGAAAYINIMFNRKITSESVIEALNYSVQTVTTVGYGNWVPPGVEPDDPRVLGVKLISIPFMLIGATVYAVLIGIVANVFSQV